jgi:acid phosphatase (class A)
MSKSFFFIVLSLYLSFAQAADIFSPAKIRGLIGDYPAHGSIEESRDFNELHRIQNIRTEKQCAEARLESDASLSVFFAGPKGPLTKKEADKISLRYLLYYMEVGANNGIAKKIYKRPRPYLTDKELRPCIPLENSYAYPSGHAAMARAFAHMLVSLYPERSEAIYQRAVEVAQNRILGGVHHPSDVVAGKKLGDAIAGSVLTESEFLREMND